MNMENIILSKISQAQNDKYCMSYLYVDSKKGNSYKQKADWQFQGAESGLRRCWLQDTKLQLQSRNKTKTSILKHGN